MQPHKTGNTCPRQVSPPHAVFDRVAGLVISKVWFDLNLSDLSGNSLTHTLQACLRGPICHGVSMDPRSQLPHNQVPGSIADMDANADAYHTSVTTYPSLILVGQGDWQWLSFAVFMCHASASAKTRHAEERTDEHCVQGLPRDWNRRLPLIREPEV